MSRRDLPWSAVFRQPEQDVLRYLNQVAEAWKKRERLGVTPLEQRRKATLAGLSRQLDELRKNTFMQRQGR